MLNRDEVIEILKEFELYYCEKCWSAWQTDTMTSSDFICVEHDEILIDEITEKINKKLGEKTK